MRSGGFDVIIVETVGVGHRKPRSPIWSICSCCCPPRSGDELQASKKYRELADLIVVNKADGDLKAQPSASAAIIRRRCACCIPPANIGSQSHHLLGAIGEGIDAIWNSVGEFAGIMQKTGALGATARPRPKPGCGKTYAKRCWRSLCRIKMSPRT